MAGDKINMPSGYGGLMHFGEEYESKFKMKPEHVVILIVLVIIFVAVLKIFKIFGWKFIVLEYKNHYKHRFIRVLIKNLE